MFYLYISNTLLLVLFKSGVKDVLFVFFTYRNDPKFSDRHVKANSADPDQTAPQGWSSLFSISSASLEAFLLHGRTF